jgi:uncharacterized protein (DUF362 family)
MGKYRAKVVEVRSAGIIKDNKIDPGEAIKMFEAGFDSLSPSGVGYDLLNRLFPSGKRIGIKVNSLAGRKMSTSPELVEALVEVLGRSGLRKSDIIVWDRRERELKRAGYSIRTKGSDHLCIATDTSGAGFSTKLYSYKSIGSMVSNIQAEMTDVVINFPVLKDHSLAGLSGCLKNYYGAIHNPNKYHENLCNPYQADLYAMEVIGGKERLAIFDAIEVQYNGGPGYVDYWANDYRSILLSEDAIALDTVGTEIINRLRTKNSMKSLKEIGREPVGDKTAGKDGLGCADLDDINWTVIEV